MKYNRAYACMNEIFLSLIVAKARNGVIGRGGRLPWHLPSDLRFFKQITLGKPVLMGRVTWESLSYALPGRPNLVLSHNPDYNAPGAEVFTDLQEMLARARDRAHELGVDEIMLIGGARLYAGLLPRCQRLYISEIKADIAGDCYFPDVDWAAWDLISTQDIEAGPKDEYDFCIRIYQRNSSYFT